MNHSTDLLPIGEAARRLGMATSALRYYESRSLVEPARAGGRRLYGRAELRKIAFIQMGRRVGVGLDQLSIVRADDGPGWRGVRAGLIEEQPATRLLASPGRFRMFTALLVWRGVRASLI